MTATSVVRPNCVPDVTALDEQRVVELEADRRPPDHVAVNVSKQPGRLDPAMVEGAPAAAVLDHLHELAERLTLL